jgi:hypothetical protein
VIHFSPCAWYCFKVPGPEGAWDIVDTPEKTTLTASDESCVMELIAARKALKTEDAEVSDLHEDFMKQESIHAVRTVLAANTYRVQTFTSRGVGADGSTWLVCHAFWANYCVLIKWFSPDSAGGPRLQAFYDLVSSIQPLALD